jgi:hypothetical protein
MMIVRNIFENDLRIALDKVNELFDGNIKFFADPVYKGKSRGGGESWWFRLSVHSTKGPGTRFSASWQRRKDGERRRISAACWHVHGHFFDALPPAAVIKTARFTVKPGDPWNEINCGSQFAPAGMSELCDCGADQHRPAERLARDLGCKVETKVINSSKLTSDCWMIQFRGIKACAACEYFDTEDCGGKEILKKIAAGQYPKTGLPNEPSTRRKQ